MIASAQTLRLLRPVEPFEERTTSHGMTYGLSPAGYDIRIAQNLVIPPGGFALASALELFRMPTHLLGVVHDKSTLARKGVALQNTVIEPGWRGYLTLEITNHSTEECFLFEGQPIAQVVFHLLDQATDSPYKGKYQDQPALPVPAIFEKEKEEK